MTRAVAARWRLLVRRRSSDAADFPLSVVKSIRLSDARATGLRPRTHPGDGANTEQNDYSKCK